MLDHYSFSNSPSGQAIMSAMRPLCWQQLRYGAGEQRKSAVTGLDTSPRSWARSPTSTCSISFQATRGLQLSRFALAVVAVIFLGRCCPKRPCVLAPLFSWLLVFASCLQPSTPTTSQQPPPHTRCYWRLSAEQALPLVRMADAVYYHASLFAFDEEARREVVRRVNEKLQNITIKCTYDDDLQVS